MFTTTYTSDTPQFGFAAPEDLKQASERAVNLWVGVMSPLWLPFLAASSFGVGAWALTRGLSTLPGSGTPWLRSDFLPGAVDELAAAPAETVAEIEKALDVAAKPVAAATEKAAEAVIDPVSETPVVPAVAEAIAEPVVAAPKAISPKAIAPKNIAKDLSVAKAKAQKAKH